MGPRRGTTPRQALGGRVLVPVILALEATTESPTVVLLTAVVPVAVPTLATAPPLLDEVGEVGRTCTVRAASTPLPAVVVGASTRHRGPIGPVVPRLATRLDGLVAPGLPDGRRPATLVAIRIAPVAGSLHGVPGALAEAEEAGLATT